MNQLPQYLSAFVCLWLGLSAPLRAETSSEQIAFFEKKIRPVLVEHCYKCHAADSKKVRGGLRLDTREALRQGGDSGAVIVAGKPEKSLLLQMMRYEEGAMPPAGKLSKRILADFRTWIEQGAVDPRGETVVTKPEPGIDLAKGKQFWAFQSPQRHTPPKVVRGDWPRKPIDHFVLARIEQHGLAPTDEADRQTWIRRVTFDLVGLPPTPEEVQAFLDDKSAQAHENVVERLLRSPHFGERWARMWLDVMRYAEDQAHIVGNNRSLCYPNAYLYRDWVIDSLNADRPFDEFVTLQLAADLRPETDKIDHVALGFLGLGPKYYNRGRLDVQADEWEDRVDVVSRGLLGVTVACARCHDHKYDPIPTEDYYALAGVFASTQMYNRPLEGAKEDKKSKGKNNNPTHTMHIVKEGKPTDLNVFLRGNVKNKGPLAQRHFLQVLSSEKPTALRNGSGRLDLAKAIVDPSNPLTARVIVNRVWAQYFGRGIVGTPSNFGFLGERPTHPELLDDLSVRFVENGWSLKWLHREIALSATYRQSSIADDKVMSIDPANRWLARMPRRRLPVEAWRDAILAAGNTLSLEVKGESIDPQDPNAKRRTIYSYISRLELNPMLVMFDFPDPNNHAARRPETTTPLQKMFVLNSPFMVNRAKALTDRLFAECQGEGESVDRQRIERAYQLLFARPANDVEVRLGLGLLGQGNASRDQWQRYAHVLLASNEMLYLD